MINYSLTKKKSNFSKESQDGKWYAIAQHNGLQNTANFVKEVCRHYRIFDEVLVMSVLTAVTETLYQGMLEGHRVITPLGTFYPVINGTGAESRGKFSNSNIKDVKVNWMPSKRFSNIIKEAKFNLTSTRQKQKEEIKLCMKRLQKDIDEDNAARKARRKKGTILNKWNTAKGGKEYDIILNAIRENPLTKVATMKELCGVSLYETKIIVNKMRDSNIIRHVGTRKGGHWEIVNE